MRGLLLRMLQSGNRSAYATILREGVAKLVVPLDFLLAAWDRRRIKSAPPSEWPVILIVGMPRAGTTLVYQVLSRYLDVTYPNNLSGLFPRSPITASRWFSRLLPHRSRKFTSYYGNTPRLSDPNEGFHIWNRWLGSDRYHAATELDADAQRAMNQFLDAWRLAFGKPFLNKSVRNTDAISVLAATIRNSYFVCVRRNPRMVVQSLILTRQHVQGGKAYGWGLYSREEAGRADPLGYVDDVCRQVLEMEQQLDRAKEELGHGRFLELDYDAFCRDPSQAVYAVASLVPDVRVHQRRMEAELRPFQPSSDSRLAPEETRRMNEVLQNLSCSTAPGRSIASTIKE